MSINNSPSAIADLTYRNYDGPIGSVSSRWMVIARTMILKSFRMRSLWTYTLLSGWYFLAMIIVLFFMQEIGASNPAAKGGLDTILNGIVWKDQFAHGFGFSQHIMLVLALTVGAGSIANDNRANALLVYLSKPTRKIDYLIGKWIGIFVPIVTAISIPTIFFYLYGLFSFRDQGFFSSDPYLLLKELAILPIAAAVHTSLILFVSSLFKQGTVAGAVYAGIYFMGYFFSLLMVIIWNVSGGKMPAWLADLNFVSIDGFIIGAARAILHPGITRPFGLPSKGAIPLPTPSVWVYIPLVIALIVLCTYGAWTRIRAVEVV